MCSNKVYAGIYSALLLLVSVSYVAADNTVWDYAPDFSKDSFPPYPDLKNPDGSNITVQNLRGVHLFGWKGCHSTESKGIKETYDDFYKMAQLAELYNNIDWKDKAAREYFRELEVFRTDSLSLEIYAAAQQIYSHPWTWQPPWLSWRQLWIEVCSQVSQNIRLSA